GRRPHAAEARRGDGRAPRGAGAQGLRRGRGRARRVAAGRVIRCARATARARRPLPAPRRRARRRRRRGARDRLGQPRGPPRRRARGARDRPLARLRRPLRAPSLRKRPRHAVFSTDVSRADETQTLWLQYRRTRDQALRDRLILTYAPLVKYVAGRLGSGLPAHVDEGDLVSYGLLGLIGAIERYEPDRDVKFETYAIARIKGAIIDELRAMDWVPRSV